MAFALVFLLIVSGLLAIPFAFPVGAGLVALGVCLHSAISPRSQDVFFAWMLMIAGVGTAVQVGIELFRRAFS